MRTARFILVLMIALEAPQFSRGQLIIGSGCCRTTGGGVRAWDEPSTAEAIAAKRVHDLPMNRSTCAAHCAALRGCTHFELNMYHQPAHSNQGVCSVFASGAYSVTTACKHHSSGRPRMHCFAKLSGGEENTRESPARLQPSGRCSSRLPAAHHDQLGPVVVLTTPYLSSFGIAMNYGDWAMEQGVQMVFSPIKLVRRSVDGVKDYCKWQKSASPQPRLLVDVAGFIYGPDGRGLQSINLTSRAALCARRAGVRVISVGVSAHAFPRGQALSKFSRMLSLFSRVFARDPNEKAKLLSVLDRRSTVPDLIRVVPDTAWLLELDCKARARNFLRQGGVRLDQPIAGIGFNRRVLAAWPSGLYHSSFEAAILAIVARFGRGQVVIIAHERGRFGPSEEDDRFWAKHYARKHSLLSTAHLVDASAHGSRGRQYEEDYIRLVDSVIGSFSVHVASRFHELAAAVRAGVPSASFSWADKYAGLLESVIDKETSVSRLLLLPSDTNATIASKLESIEQAYQEGFGTKRAALKAAVHDALLSELELSSNNTQVVGANVLRNL